MRTEPITFEQFMGEAQQDLQGCLSLLYPDIRVEIQDVAKVQGESYRGLMFRRDRYLTSPVFNLQPFYEQLSSQSYEIVLADLVEGAMDILKKPVTIDKEEIMDYELMKKKLMTQVISAKDNAARLLELPYRQMKDMAIIYRFMLGDDGHGNMMSAMVTNAMLETYGISREQLYADAIAAMTENHTYSIRPMGMVLSEMDPDFGEPLGPPGLYVATMDTKMYGASVITLPEFMENAAGIVKGDFYVLPSSIHEVLLLQDDGHGDPRQLQEMVESINATMLDPSDKLTDNVYHYDATERLFETVREYTDRMAEKSMDKRPSLLKELAEQKQKMREYTPRHHRPPERSSAIL